MKNTLIAMMIGVCVAFGFNSNIASAEIVYTFQYNGYDIYLDTDSVNGCDENFNCIVVLKDLNSGVMSREGLTYVMDSKKNLTVTTESGNSYNVYPIDQPAYWAIYLKAICYLPLKA